MLKARVDRHRCVGAGNCITIAPTAFDWVEGDYAKADVLDVTTIDEEQLREAALSCPTQAIWIEDVIAMIESSASSELYALLKRQDEKAVTERAYENPVFVEDMVRNVALKLKAHPDVTWYKVEAENQESIHNHNAYASIEKG